MGTILVQIGVFLSILTLIATILGEYIAKVFKGEKTLISVIFRPIEKILYKIFSIDEDQQMDWKTYSFSFVIFSLLGITALFVLQELQHLLPLNPQGFGPVRWDTALNTAVSFVTNTNWQAYGGETTMSYLTQMLGMTLQNFLSAAAGIAAAFAVIRAFINKKDQNQEKTNSLGNFWVDLTRSIIYILLPLSILFSLVFVSQGSIQNFNKYANIQTIEGQKQLISQGPVASQVAIKILGTNGGGFFNANSAHPYENPTPMTDYMQILGLLIIAAAFPFTFGALLKNRRQGWAIFLVMMTLYILGLAIAIYSESHGNPILSKVGIENGINMEGKEVRFGILSSTVFAQSTTVTSCGAVNSMHDSMMPLTGLILMFNMMIGEVIFGGVGAGFIGIILYSILTMFLVGLMIGRTPEVFGKKLEPFEMIMAVIAIVLPSVIQLIFGAIASSSTIVLSSLNNSGAHGLSEIIYAFASGAGNNGSAFAGLNANTIFYNLMLAVAMLVGRFGTILPSLAIAGSLINKKFVPEESKFPTAGPIFVLMLISVILIVGALTFFPVLALGPILEHLFTLSGNLF